MLHPCGCAPATVTHAQLRLDSLLSLRGTYFSVSYIWCDIARQNNEPHGSSAQIAIPRMLHSMHFKSDRKIGTIIQKHLNYNRRDPRSQSIIYEQSLAFSTFTYRYQTTCEIHPCTHIDNQVWSFVQEESGIKVISMSFWMTPVVGLGCLKGRG